MRRDDGGVNLPRPYGEAFEADDGLEELIDNRLARMERSRRFWGHISSNWAWSLFRNLIPLLMLISTIVVMSLPEKFSPSLAATISCNTNTNFCCTIDDHSESCPLGRHGALWGERPLTR